MIRRTEIIRSSPISPRSTSSFATRVASRNRVMCATIRRTPAARHASIIASHSATFRPIGFSRKTCLPAAAAASDQRQMGGVGRRDHDGVDVLPFQQRIDRGVHRDPVLGREAARPRCRRRRPRAARLARRSRSPSRESAPSRRTRSCRTRPRGRPPRSLPSATVRASTLGRRATARGTRRTSIGTGRRAEWASSSRMRD